MATLGEYLLTWKLKLSTTKTVPALFHLNKEAKRELKVNFNNETLPFYSEPKYLGVTLDRSLTYRRHLESLRKKLTSRVALLKRLACSGWGAGVTTLGTATLALVHSTGLLFGAAVLTDPAMNDAVRIVTGCLRPTPADNLPMLAGIQPAELCRSGATLPLARCAREPAPLCAHTSIECRCTALQIETPICTRRTAAHPTTYIRAARWADHQWNAEWLDNPTRLRILIPDTGSHPPGITLPTASAPMSDVSAPACTNGVRPSLWRRRNRRSCCSPLSNPLTSPWTAWPDGSGQSNGCSTPAPRSGAVKQWIKELAQKKMALRFDAILYSK